MVNLKFKIFVFFIGNLFLLAGYSNIGEIFGKVSKTIGITPSSLKIDKTDLEFYGYGEFRLKLFDQFIDNPLKLDNYTRTMSHTILNNADSLWAISYFSWARIDEGVRRGFLERQNDILVKSIPKQDSLDTAFLNLLQNFYGCDSIMINEIPEFLKIGLFLLLTEIKNSINWRDKGIKHLSDEMYDTIISYLTGTDEEELSNVAIENLIINNDLKALAAGAVDLSYVVQTAIDLMKEKGVVKTIKIETKYGMVIIGGIDDDIYKPFPYLLIIDFGGNDTYESGGIADKKHPVSIIIDYYGNDNYTGEVGCGTGIAGYGFVIDLNGNDTYYAKKFGLGTGILGQGIILDLSGDDQYNVNNYGIGAGIFGTGIVSDIAGNDKYTGFQECQGFGFVKGAGLLIDKTGNDIYNARDDTIRYPSFQTPEHNVSLSQGTGFGIRADFSDGHSLAGGIGMLIDGEGDDKYTCGVFGQGCGYWFGLGFLIDFSGNDEYNGIWYVQGAGAHFAIGALLDSTGDDKYVATKNMAQGAGHDFALGLLFNYEGNDLYDAPNLSLGSGNANGMGLFIDFKGDDKYITHGGITIGNASTASRGSIRDYIKTLGIFIDSEGADIYTEKVAGNKKIWRQKSPLEPSLKTEIGIGIDF